jgi:hypothetical protein
MYRFVNLPMLFDALVSLYADVRNKAAKRLSIPPGRTRAVPASLEPNADDCTEFRLAMADAPSTPLRRAA